MIAEPAKAALRKARRAERPPRKVCVECIVEHHFLGRKHDPHFIVDACEYHHSLVHDEWLDAGIDPKLKQNAVERQIEILKIEAFYFRRKADQYRDWADAKERQADALQKYLEENPK